MTWAEDAIDAIYSGVGALNDASNELKGNATLIANQHEQIAALQAELDALKNPPPPVPTGWIPPKCALGFGGADLPGATARRVFLNPGDPFPKPLDRVLHLVTYKGPDDHALRVQQAKAYGRPILLGFHHEPEGPGGPDFSPFNYKAEWGNLDDELLKQGKGNIRTLWVMMGASFRSETAAAYYPTGLVDVVGADPYDHLSGAKANGGYLKPGVVRDSFAKCINAALVFAKNHSLPLAICETGTPARLDGNETERVFWVQDALKYAKTQPGLAAICYFQRGLKDHNAVEWALKGASLDAYRTGLADPYFGGMPG